MNHQNQQKSTPEIHIVESTDSPEFTHLTRSLTRSTIIGLDAEWPSRHHQTHTHTHSPFPPVSVLQLACRTRPDPDSKNESDSVFLLDLLSLPLDSVWVLLSDVFASPDVLKLGFRFKQDLVYLSSTFCSNGCDPGFEKVEPYLDITSLYHYLVHKQIKRKIPKENKSLATICKELLGIYLSKELQCSDWSHRPLTEEQKTYAAADAHCLLMIFDVFQGNSSNDATDLNFSTRNLGLKEILVLEQHDMGDRINIKISEASEIIKATISTEYSQGTLEEDEIVFRSSNRSTMHMDEALGKIVRKYGEKIILKEADRKPRTSKKKVKKGSSVSVVNGEKQLYSVENWQGPAPWDLSVGGDGCPKFLCDVMVEGLAKHLRCVGIDAAIPYSKKPEPRELIDQANKEQRVLLTRDAKLLRHQYLVNNQIYRVNSLHKKEQLIEVIDTFQIKINENQLMTRCTKCNGRFIQKPLSTEEAIEAGKGFQRIPSCLFNKDLEFWQCMDCKQLYWEGTQYHNAVQKFIDICKLNE